MALHSFFEGFIKVNYFLLLLLIKKKDPTLNTLNNTDLNTSFDHFVKNIKLASNGEVNWSLNDIDTSQFKSISFEFQKKFFSNLNLKFIYCCSCVKI